MSGRTEQLGRQLRRLRTSAANDDLEGAQTAVRRAAHLARDLALEHTDAEEVQAAFGDLAKRGVIVFDTAENVARWIESYEEGITDEMPVLMNAGQDFDRFLRSIEHGAPMPELPFLPLTPTEPMPAASKAALTISGRHVAIAERGGEGLVFVDDRPVGRPFELRSAPRGKAEVVHDPSGVTRIMWEAEGLVVELAGDFASARRV